MASVLYLTQDGITDHIGQAQIAPYLLGLARLGHRIHVVSAEKPGRPVLMEKYKRLFDDAGIAWSTVRYANKPPLISSVVVLRRMYLAARAIASSQRPDIIHCRSYLPFEIALRLKREFGSKLLLDVRDFWPDLRLETHPFKFVYRQLKRREPAYFAAADHVVTLTDKAVEVLRDRYPGGVSGRGEGYTVIPCCADFDHFNPRKVDVAAVERHRDELRLGEGLILIYLGSLGPDYLLPEMLKLFKELLAIHPSAKFLFVSNNAAEAVERERAALGIAPDAIRFVSVERAQVPEYIALADLSVVFVRQTPAKAGGSPTKLAELFALNVPVIGNSGIGDMDDILDYRRNGSVIVHDFQPATLRAALLQVLRKPSVAAGTIRESAQQFSLDEGVGRYDRVYRNLADVKKEQPDEPLVLSC
jgi:glycosyltransferase involved in cell wall biosynthesis